MSLDRGWEEQRECEHCEVLALQRTGLLMDLWRNWGFDWPALGGISHIGRTKGLGFMKKRACNRLRRVLDRRSTSRETFRAAGKIPGG